MSTNSWCEISLTVTGELAEAVAEVLSRYAPGGVVIESTTLPQSHDGEQSFASGPVRVSAYLRVDDNLEHTRHQLEESLWYLGRIQALPAAEFRIIEEADWASAWKEHYHPIQIGNRLIIVPAWLEIEVGDRIPILMDPGMAFGTGTHPTTQLCMRFMENWFVSRSDQGKEAGTIDVIDIGCGSGILTIAALKLGAQQVLALDLDPQAVDITRRNARINNTQGNLEAVQGSLEEALAGIYTIRQADLVLANILAPVLVRLLDEGLGMLLKPGGSLILSGIIEEQLGDVRDAAERNKLQVIETLQIEDWVALRICR